MFWLVTGRADGDEEDTALTFPCKTQGEAREAFISYLREDMLQNQIDGAATTPIYINTVAFSPRPIEIVSTPPYG